MENKFKVFILMCMAVLGCSGHNHFPDVDYSGITSMTADLEGVLIPGSEELAWQIGDEIGVFSAENDNVRWQLRSKSEGQKEATFYGPVVKGGEVCAYYPYSEGVYRHNGGISVELPQVQFYNPGETAVAHFLSVKPTAISGVDQDKMFFRYPYGLVRITTDLKQEIEISGLSFEGDMALSGWFNLGMDASLTPSAGAKKSVELEMDEPVMSSSTMSLYVVMPPMDDANLTLTIKMDGQESMVLSVNDLTVNRIMEGSFNIASICVKSGGVVSMNQINGYLE